VDAITDQPLVNAVSGARGGYVGIGRLPEMKKPGN